MLIPQVHSKNLVVLTVATQRRTSSTDLAPLKMLNTSAVAALPDDFLEFIVHISTVFKLHNKHTQRQTYYKRKRETEWRI